MDSIERRMPKVSVITVTYKDLGGLKKTRASIESQIYAGEIENVIVDGGSGTDVSDFLAGLSSENVNWLSEPDDGVYPAMNKGVDRSSGDVLWFMNSGDLFGDPFSVQNAMDNLTNPAHEWGYGFSRWFSVDGEFDGIHGAFPYNFTLHVLGKHAIPHQSSFIGAVLFADVGPFPENVPIMGDQVVMMRAAQRVKPVVVPHILSTYDTGGVSSGHSRHTHWTWARDARRKSGVRILGRPWLDELTTYGLEVGEAAIIRLRRFGRTK
ncbi:glycosyltransferase [Agreia sp. PsM10]|uniref:glycosyltransferase n=1 Tax=Agreia sp. PsM10 TaxID=3030533 RepID=UPI00263B86CE|nr:glycosyltransferase [Agreia sp. PsM10]MDN4641976.1 glycosyltransferase [Agreia sp. PsM10]